MIITDSAGIDAVRVIGIVHMLYFVDNCFVFLLDQNLLYTKI